jgi:hypothetical protein
MAPPRDHFKKMLEAPCPYHEGPVKRAFKDCNLMKNYLGGTAKNKLQDATKAGAAKNADHDEFPKEDGAVMMIFNGMPTLLLRCKHMCILQEIYHTEPVVTSYLWWSETAVTYDRADHPDHIPQPGAYPLVVALLFDSKRVQNVLMYWGNNLNIVYMSTLDSMGI